MDEKTCSKCGGELKRFSGWTWVLFFLTGGWLIFALPFFNKKCKTCKTKIPNTSIAAGMGITKDNWFKKWQVWAVVAVFVIPLSIGGNLKPPAESPEEIAAKMQERQEASDELMARVFAKQFVEKSLKSPSTAKFPNPADFAVAPVKDKKGNKIKDVWEVSGYVDAQNSLGAMLRNNWYVKMGKVQDNWVLLKIQMW